MVFVYEFLLLLLLLLSTYNSTVVRNHINVPTALMPCFHLFYILMGPFTLLLVVIEFLGKINIRFQKRIFYRRLTFHAQYFYNQEFLFPKNLEAFGSKVDITFTNSASLNSFLITGLVKIPSFNLPSDKLGKHELGYLKVLPSCGYIFWLDQVWCEVMEVILYRNLLMSVCILVQLPILLWNANQIFPY